MKKRSLFFIMSLMLSGCVGISGDATEEEELSKYKIRKKEIAVQVAEISEKCWEKTATESEKKWEATQDKSVIITTQDMMRHGDDWNICMEEKIKKEIRKLFDKEYAEKNIEYLLMAEKGIGNLYYNAYNINKYCSPYCGTMNHPRGNAELDEYLQMILVDMIIVNETEGLGFYPD